MGSYGPSSTPHWHEELRPSDFMVQIPPFGICQARYWVTYRFCKSQGGLFYQGESPISRHWVAI